MWSSAECEARGGRGATVRRTCEKGTVLEWNESVNHRTLHTTHLREEDTGSHEEQAHCLARRRLTKRERE